MLDLNVLKKECFEIQNRRIENGANLGSDVLKHLAGELVEAVNARNDYKEAITYSFGINEENRRKKEYAEELADIIICTLIAAKQDNIDIEKALVEKIEKNRKRAELKGDKL